MRLKKTLYQLGWPNGEIITNSVLANIEYQNLFSDSRTGTKTPGFHKRVESGDRPLPVNAYSRSIKSGLAYATGQRRQKVRYYLAGAKMPYFGRDYTYLGYLTATPVTHATFLASYSSERANNSADSIARLKNHIENVKVDAPVELGEGKESVEMVLNRVKGLANYASHFKVKNGNAVRSLKKAFAANARRGSRSKYIKGLADDANNLFLEYNFGWKPLYGLFGDAATLLHDQLEKKAPRVKMVGKSTFEAESVILTNTLFYSPLNTLGSFTMETKHAYKHTVWHGGQLTSTEERESLQQQLGLSAGNIIPALWELVSLSFIADYFTNIGDVLANLRNSQSKLNPITLYKSEKWEYELSVRYTKIVDYHEVPGANTRYIEPFFVQTDEGTANYMTFTRSLATPTGLITPFHVKSPSWDHIVKTLSVALAVTGALRK